MMNQCNECESQFEEPKRALEDWGTLTLICPYCNSDDWDEMTKCAICGEYIKSDKDFCELCEIDWGFRIAELVANGPGERDGIINYMIKWIENQ